MHQIRNRRSFAYLSGMPLTGKADCLVKTVCHVYSPLNLLFSNPFLHSTRNRPAHNPYFPAKTQGKAAPHSSPTPLPCPSFPQAVPVPTFFSTTISIRHKCPRNTAPRQLFRENSSESLLFPTPHLPNPYSDTTPPRFAVLALAGSTALIRLCRSNPSCLSCTSCSSCFRLASATAAPAGLTAENGKTVAKRMPPGAIYANFLTQSAVISRITHDLPQ